MRKFIPLRKGHHRARSETRSDIGPIEAQMEVDPLELRPTESTPDLGIGSSTLPTPGPLASHDQESSGTRSNFSQMNHLTTLSRNPDRNTASDLFRSVFRTGSKRNRANSSDDTVDPRATSKGKSDFKSLAYSGAKLILRGVNESAGAFPPLKSTAAALCFILDNCEVRSTSVPSPDPRCLCSFQGAIACHQTIESLTPRVQELARLLGGPVPDGEDKENERRSILGR